MTGNALKPTFNRQIKSISETGCEPETSESGADLHDVLKTLESNPRPKKLIKEVRPGSFTDNGSLPETDCEPRNPKNGGKLKLSQANEAKDELQEKVLTGEDASLVGQLQKIIPPSEREKVTSVIIFKLNYNYWR